MGLGQPHVHGASSKARYGAPETRRPRHGPWLMRTYGHAEGPGGQRRAHSVRGPDQGGLGGGGLSKVLQKATGGGCQDKDKSPYEGFQAQTPGAEAAPSPAPNWCRAKPLKKAPQRQAWPAQRGGVWGLKVAHI